MRKNWILYRIIVGILIFCMIFETGATQVLASGLTFDNSSPAPDNNSYNNDSSSDNDSNNNNPNSGNNSDNNGSDSDNGTDNSNPASGNNSNNNGSGSDNDNSDNNDSDSDNNTGNSNPDASDNSDSNPDNSNSDSDTDSDNGNSDPDTDNNNADEDTDADTEDANEDNDQSADTSPNETDKEALASKQANDIAIAEKAFMDILSGKDVMALIYLTDIYHVRSMADKNSDIVADIESGHTVYLRGVTITQDEVWYKVSFWINGTQTEGYVERKYLAYSDEEWLKWDSEYLYELANNDYIGYSAVGGISSYALSYEDVAQFPAGYQTALTQLKSSHPNWTFVPMNTKLDFNTAVSAEMGVKSLIQNTTNNASKGWVGASCPTTAGWYYATRDAVSYHMDPRNFLTETYIFQFEQLTFNSSYHTVDAIQTFLNSTFMKGTLPDDSKKRTYAQAFYEIGQARKLSPIHLASRVYQEQGQGTSGLISGTYPGYEGYYNFFNVNANGGTTAAVIVNGLKHAKSMGWNTRYKSLEGGAATIGNNYILKGQDTLYLEKFNVNSNSSHALYEHQYMQNIQAPSAESSSTKKMYASANSLNSAFVFKIPVYSNMPGLKLNKTNVKLEKGDNLTLTASVNGTALDSGSVTWKSSNTAVATVSNGTVTAVNAGTAIITASYDGNEASCTVVVINPLKQITLDRDEVTLRRPDTIVKDTGNLSKEELSSNISSTELKVSFDPEDTTDDKTITWTSSNKKVATVQDGIVTAVGIGEATITAKASKAGNKTAKCKVTVIAPVYSIEFSSDDNTDRILTGQGINLSVSYLPLDTTSDTTVIWKSSDTSVATVARTKGSVRGISAGTADITATIGGYSASHRITVEGCSVTFMDKDNTTILKTISTSYGSKIPQETFPNMDSTDSSMQGSNDSGQGADDSGQDSDASVFVGWYTGADGAGSRFDHSTLIHQKETTVYPCFKQQGRGFYVVPIGDQTYTGSAIKPEIVVYDGTSYYDGMSNETDTDKERASEGSTLYEDDASKDTVRKPVQLVLNKDYTVSYKNNKKTALTTDAKPPTITVKGKGNYAGTETITFNIITKSLTDTDITADNITAAYNGKTIKSTPIIYHNGRKLVKNTDYKVTYPLTGAGAYRNAGTYPVTITGTGGYHGTLTVYETISPKVLLSKVTIAKIPTQVYDPSQIDKENGVGIEPPLTVTYKGKNLTQSTDGGITGDYVITYKNNLNTGTATATITAVDNEENLYTGSKSITFKIAATSISKASISGIEPKTYNGLEEDVRQNSISVSLSGNTLTESTDGGKTGDYVLEYKNINKAGTATVIVKGINKYTGTKKQTYKITACDLDQIKSDISLSYCSEDKDIDNPDNITDINSLDNITTPYVKGGSKPVVLLSYKERTLEVGKDYTVKYKNNNVVTAENTPANKLPMITITGKGLFKGKISGTFRITTAPLSDEDDKVVMTANDVVYTAKKGAYKTKITLTDSNGKKLQAGKDYEKTLRYTYANAGDEAEVNENDIPNVGTAIRVTVQGKGAYAGNGENTASKSAIYYITSADISKAKVTIAAKTYNGGRAVTLEKDDITVTLNGKELVFGEDYKIIYDADINKYCNKGKAPVTIKGTGTKYGGTKKISFTIKGKTMSWFK